MMSLLVKGMRRPRALKTTFVDQVANALEVGVAPGNAGFPNTQHVQGSL